MNCSIRDSAILPHHRDTPGAKVSYGFDTPAKRPAGG
jgi:hypothetical protein